MGPWNQRARPPLGLQVEEAAEAEHDAVGKEAVAVEHSLTWSEKLPADVGPRRFP